MPVKPPPRRADSVSARSAEARADATRARSALSPTLRAALHPTGFLGLTATSHATSEDELLAFLLIKTWTLATGRVLPPDVPPSQLSEEELIAFWADDHIARGD
jgi:hypothetical protein